MLMLQRLSAPRQAELRRLLRAPDGSADEGLLGYKGGMVKPSEVPAIRLNLTLVDVEPPVWREVVVPGAWHLGKLHEVIQVAMGWGDAHLHEFAAGELRWGQPDLGWGDTAEVRREVTARLHEVLAGVGAVLSYTYDFGDDWRHELTALELLPPAVTATCLAGEGACPPEDCGGPWGYQDLLAVLADPAHPEHADRLEWTGGTIDPTRFDVASVASILGAMR